MPTLREIRAEIDADPTRRGYASCIIEKLPIDPGDLSKGTRISASDASIADLMNEVRRAIKVIDPDPDIGLRPGSRAEELWGAGTRIRHQQVAEAFGRK